MCTCITLVTLTLVAGNDRGCSVKQEQEIDKREWYCSHMMMMSLIRDESNCETRFERTVVRETNVDIHSHLPFLTSRSLLLCPPPNDSNNNTKKGTVWTVDGTGVPYR